MKLTTTLATALLFAASTQLTNDAPAQSLQIDDTLTACAFYPLCDLDIYSPAPQPSDKKIDTKDKAKDGKVA